MEQFNSSGSRIQKAKRPALSLNPAPAWVNNTANEPLSCYLPINPGRIIGKTERHTVNSLILLQQDVCQLTIISIFWILLLCWWFTSSWTDRVTKTSNLQINFTLQKKKNIIWHAIFREDLKIVFLQTILFLWRTVSLDFEVSEDKKSSCSSLYVETV